MTGTGGLTENKLTDEQREVLETDAERDDGLGAVARALLELEEGRST